MSDRPTFLLNLELPGNKRYEREITREQYEQLIKPILDRTIGPCKQALKDAGLKPSQIDEVVAVGGSTRIPKVRALIHDMFERPPHTDLNPDEVVALGAAVQANILGGGSEATKDMLLLDVTPLSLGIEVAGGVTDKIILRNSTIPASATQHYTTQVDGQANVAIHVLQGERELAKDCRSLARFDLKGIPPMTAGMPRIEVKFLIDANGILQVTAREQRSGTEAQIEVQPSYGLTDEQVENMILESFDSAEEDFRQRQIIEARNEADTIQTALEKGKKNTAWGSALQRRTKTNREAGKSTERSKRRRRLPGHPQSHRCAESGDHSTGRINDGQRGGHSPQRQDHGSGGHGEGPDAPHPMAKAEFE